MAEDERHALERDKGGAVIVCPVTAWTIFSAIESYIGVRLEFLRLQGQRETEGAVQIALTPAQCRELAEALLRRADQISLPRPGDSHH